MNMSESTDNLVLEQLRHIRGKVDQVATDTDDIKNRMSSLESSMLIVKREMNHGDEVDARLQTTLDKLSKRIEGIEERLELTN
jgi:septal ring factor EnvC (AmiA/AmiB activator)